MNYFGSIFAMVVCIAMSAYFSATETAFSSLNKLAEACALPANGCTTSKAGG